MDLNALLRRAVDLGASDVQELADSLADLLAARLLTYHAAHAFDTAEDRKLVTLLLLSAPARTALLIMDVQPGIVELARATSRRPSAR